MKFERKKKISLLIWTAIILFSIVIDLITKHFIMDINMEVIPGFFKFEYAKNTGAAWSIFSGSTVALILISVFAIIMLSFYSIFSKTADKLFHISLGLIIGGALGNLFDRIVFGYVRDFIKLQFVNFPIFNIADSLLTVGVVCLCVYYLIEAIKEIKKAKQKKD